MMKLAFAFLLVLLLTDIGNSRLIKENVVMISDGIYTASQKVAGPTVTCEPAYGFLPCTTELWGHLFLIVVYQYLLSLGQKYVSEGSDLFFTAFGPGIFGASFFHFLGTIPQVALILVSRLSGDSSNARAQAGIGMSLLAGSAVLNLTLIWGTAVALGSHDLSEEPNSSQLEHKKTGFGVATDVDTSYTARIMIISIVPLLILQLTKIVRSSSGSQWIVLISLIVTLAILLSYVLYQTFQPWIQNRRFEYLTLKFAKDKLLRVLLVGGKPNEPLIREIFHEIDRNKNSHISTAELRLLILGIQIEDDGFIRADYAEKFIEMFDISGDDNIDEDEFVKGMSKWLIEAKKSVNRQDHKVPNNNTEDGQSLLVQRKQTLRSEDSWRTYTKAAYFLVLGTAISAVLALPLIQSVVGFVSVTNIPSFFIPYVVIPLTLSFRTAKQTITSARQKTSNSISLTLSQIYGSVFMSNMIGLVTFLIVVYVRELPVGSSAEFLVAIVTITVMGAYTSFKTDFSRWASYVAILVYPVSLFVLYVLTSVLGWS